MRIRRLSPDDAAAYRRLRLRGLRLHPHAFGRSHREEAKLPLRVFAERLQPSAGKWTFGAFEGAALVGIVTLVREPSLKGRHKALIVGMYVHEKCAGCGIGRALLARVLAKARTWRGLRLVILYVIEGNDRALAMYKKAGFVVYGREADSLRIGRRFFAEWWLVKRLPGRG